MILSTGLEGCGSADDGDKGLHTPLQYGQGCPLSCPHGVQANANGNSAN